MPKLDTSLALVAVGLILVLSIILAKRGLHRRFPVFFGYCIWTLLVAIIRFRGTKDPLLFFIVYWLTETSYLIVAFLAMLALLRPFTEVTYERHPWSRFLLLPAILFTFAMPLWLAFVRPIQRNPVGRFASGVYAFAILMCLVELGLFITALAIRRRYSIQWSRYEFGILEGFGTLALLNLVAYVALILRLLHLHVAPQVESIFRSFPSAAFIGSAIVWLNAFRRPEPPTTYRPPDLGKLRETAFLLREQIQFVTDAMRAYGSGRKPSRTPDDHSQLSRVETNPS